jgi:hypothetical protein
LVAPIQVAFGEPRDPARVARFPLVGGRLRGATRRKIVDVIRVRAPSNAHAERLLAALDGGFAATLNGDSPATEVELRPDSETAKKLVELFDALGLWLSSGGLDAVQIGFGERTYTLFAASEGKPNDPTGFLLERAIQLQTALDSRIVIEQAKGILAERETITPNEAFDKMRREARSKRIKLHDLATAIVKTASSPAGQLHG